MVFPTPGAPWRKRWCRPAAATSSANFPSSCPTTSARSGVNEAGPSKGGEDDGAASVGLKTGLPSSRSTTSARRPAPQTVIPGTRAASACWPAGTIARSKPAREAANMAGSTPRTFRMRPSRLNSPISTVRVSETSSICSSAMSAATAMARSKWVPALGRLAGDRLMVTRPGGQERPEASTAARTLALASLSEASGRPTSWTRGRPPPFAASTSTGNPSMPDRATDHTHRPTIRQSPGRT